MLATLSIPKVSYASDKDELLADFLYSLVNYIKWENKSAVNICTYGYDDISTNLTRITKEEPFQNNAKSPIKEVNIKLNVAFDAIPSCDLLYISENQEKNVLLVLDKVKDLPIITASYLENFIAIGGVMEFKVMRRKVQLKVGQKALGRTGIALSPVILMSARPGTSSE